MNQCGECTVCCTLLPVKWLNKPAGESCIHCQGGCTIHDVKPAECSDFECAWLQSNVDNPDLRPDRCGIIFEKTTDGDMFGTVVSSERVSDTARRQLHDFVAQGYTVRLTEQV